MKKITYLILICFISLFSLTGCFTKKEITTKEFIKIVEKDNYQVYDVKEQYNYESIKAATIAVNKNEEYQIEFYELESNKDANSMFLKNKQIFEDAAKEENQIHSSMEMSNYSTFKVVTSDKFKYLCKVNSTLLFINVDKQYQKQVEETIKKLGY